MPAQGWAIDVTADTITFVNAPANGAAIAIRKYDSTSYNATPIWAFGAWSNSRGWPREVEYYADRVVFASSVAQPQTLWMSKTADYNNFGKSTPIEDSDAITATINARQINTIRDLVPLKELLILTSGGEWKLSQGQNNVLTPSTVGFDPQTWWGVSDIPTTVVGSNAVFVQDRGNIVRDMSYEFSADGYVGNNLSIYSQHLLEGHELVDVAFQQVPFNVVWMVRDDGILLSMTYIKEQQIIGWARHDTRGLVESICCIPEGAEDALYMVVRRKVQGVYQRYVERMYTRDQTDPLKPWFLDSALSYDGRNTASNGITIGPTGIASSAYPVFAGMSIGDGITVEETVTAYDPEVGAEVSKMVEVARFRVAALGLTPYTVSVTAVGPLPESLIGVLIETYTLQRDTFSGLDHLEGLTVGGTGDGDVLPPRVVTGGQVSYSRPYGVVVIGLPYYSDLQTLDVNILGGETVRQNQKIISKIAVMVDNSRNLKVGSRFDRLSEVKVRATSELFADPVSPVTGAYIADVTDNWVSKGRACMRQDAPLPLTVLSITPTVSVGGVAGSD